MSKNSTIQAASTERQSAANGSDMSNEQVLVRLDRLSELLELLLDRTPREIRLPVTERFRPVPQKVYLEEVLDFFGIKKTAFYNNVYRRLLFPVLTIGNRNYYDREEMHDLLRRRNESRLPYRELDPVGQTELSIAA